MSFFIKKKNFVAGSINLKSVWWWWWCVFLNSHFILLKWRRSSWKRENPRPFILSELFTSFLQIIEKCGARRNNKLCTTLYIYWAHIFLKGFLNFCFWSIFLNHTHTHTHERIYAMLTVKAYTYDRNSTP